MAGTGIWGVVFAGTVMGANGRQWASMGLGRCLLNTKVFTPDLDNMEKVDLSKGFGNSRKKL